MASHKQQPKKGGIGKLCQWLATSMVNCISAYESENMNWWSCCQTLTSCCLQRCGSSWSLTDLTTMLAEHGIKTGA